MLFNSLDYTVRSNNPDCYNRIYCNLMTPPPTKYASMIVTSLTYKFDVVILNSQDYIEFQEFKDGEWIDENKVKYYFSNEYSPMDFAGIYSLLLTEFGEKYELEKKKKDSFFEWISEVFRRDYFCICFIICS